MLKNRCAKSSLLRCLSKWQLREATAFVKRVNSIQENIPFGRQDVERMREEVLIEREGKDKVGAERRGFLLLFYFIKPQASLKKSARMALTYSRFLWIKGAQRYALVFLSRCYAYPICMQILSWLFVFSSIGSLIRTVGWCWWMCPWVGQAFHYLHLYM